MTDIVESIAKHKNRSKLARLIMTLATAVHEERGGRLGDGVLEVLAELELPAEKTRIADFQVSEVLQKESEGVPLTSDQAAVLGALFALGVSQLGIDGETAPSMAEKICWLGAQTPLDPSPWLPHYLEEGTAAAALWAALATCAGAVDHAERAEGMVALSCLIASPDPAAVEALAGIDAADCDPTLAVLLEAVRRPQRASRGSFSDELPTVPRRADSEAWSEALEGEIVAGRVAGASLVLQGLTGILLLRWLWRGLTVGILRLRRKGELRLDAKGIELRVERSIVGRPLSSKVTHIPWGNLARLSRELSYPQLATFAGLVAALVGTYAGVRFLVDGARSGSPWLLLLGVGLPLLGLICDFVFGRLLASRAGQGFLSAEPRKGRGFSLRCDKVEAIDGFLRRAQSLLDG